jgi:hypothetical protein
VKGGKTDSCFCSVQDADKLDAIGAFGSALLSCAQRPYSCSVLPTGILRCAAYSGAISRPLFIPPSSPAPTAAPGRSSAIDHFHEKLFNIQGTMKTERGTALAKRRTEFMRGFVEQVESEWQEIAGGESNCRSLCEGFRARLPLLTRTLPPPLCFGFSLVRREPVRGGSSSQGAREESRAD